MVNPPLNSEFQYLERRNHLNPVIRKAILPSSHVNRVVSQVPKPPLNKVSIEDWKHHLAMVEGFVNKVEANYPPGAFEGFRNFLQSCNNEDEIPTNKLKDLIEWLHKLATLPQNPNVDIPSKEISETFLYFKEPFKFLLFRRLFEGLYKEVLGVVQFIYQKPGDTRGMGIKGHGDVQLNPSPISLGVEGEAKGLHMISDTSAVVKIWQGIFRFGLGLGDVIAGGANFKVNMGIEELRGFDTFPRYARDLTWGKIQDRLHQEAPGIFDKPLETILRDCQTKSRKLLERMAFHLPNSDYELEVTAPEWNYPFRVATGHWGYTAGEHAMNKVFQGEVTADGQQGTCYYHGDSLLGGLLDNNGYIFTEQAKKILKKTYPYPQPELSPLAIEKDFIEMATKEGLKERDFDSLKGSLQESINHQISKLQDYYSLVSKYDLSKSNPATQSDRKALKQAKKAAEKELGVRGRAEFILACTLQFAKSVKLCRRIQNQEEFVKTDESEYLQSLHQYYDLFKTPPIFLNNRQIKRATHMAIKTPVHWDRLSTNVSIDLGSFGAPCKLDVKVDFHDVHHWGVPELEGQYFEITTSLSAALPYASQSAAVTYAIGSVIDFVRKKYHHSLNIRELKSELKDTLLLLNSNIPASGAGISAVNLIQKDPASKEFKMLYTRCLVNWGHNVPIRGGLPGVAAGGVDMHLKNGKVVAERIGTGTLKYLWRQFSGHINNKNKPEWDKFVKRNRPGFKKIFCNILEENHSAKASFEAFMNELEHSIKYGQPSPIDTLEDYKKRREAFLGAAGDLRENPDDDDEALDKSIKAFENLFTLYLETSWRDRLARMYTISFV